MDDARVLIYGAYGYTGRMIATYARDQHIPITLAGRRRGPLVELATALDVPYSTFDLDNQAAVSRHIEPFSVVLHCAGPFSQTASPMIEACLAARTHYLDISGEIDVFEMCHSRQAQAVEAGIVMCPGSGFDVVPTDCVALNLYHALPDAERLTLGFEMPGGMSPGTAKTVVNGLGHGGRVRRNGKIAAVPLAFRTREIDFGNGRRHAVSIPWGDVSTAFHTTGIGNITTYVPMSPGRVKQLRRLNLLRAKFLQPALGWLGHRYVKKNVRGPDLATRRASSGCVWGEVRNAQGDIRTARMQTANGYDVTVEASVRIADYVRQGTHSSGVWTPARLMGAEFASSLQGSSPVEIS